MMGIIYYYNIVLSGDIKWFLSIRVICDKVEQKLWLFYNIYIKKIIKKFNII